MRGSEKMAAKGKSPNEKEVEALPPGTAAEEARLFEEVVGDRPTIEPPPWRIDDGPFRADLAEAARASPDDVDFAQGVSENFKRIVEGLVDVALQRPDDMSKIRAFFLEEDAQDVKGSAQWLIDLKLQDQGLKGELLLYVSDLVFAAFDIAKHGSGSHSDVLQTKLREQRSVQGAKGGNASSLSRNKQVDKRREWIRPLARQIKASKKISFDDLAHELLDEIKMRGWPSQIKKVGLRTIREDLGELFSRKKKSSSF